MPAPRRCRGAALPVCLALALLTSLAGLQALTAARIEASMAGAHARSSRDFLRAETALHGALAFADNSPTLLPAELGDPPVALTAVNAQVNISVVAQDDVCPDYATGQRTHYEARAIVHSEAYQQRVHLRGFYICSESCTPPGCLAAAGPVTATYWSMLETD